MVIELMIRSEVPVFLMVMVLGEDAPPTGIEPRLTDIGLTEIAGGGVCPESFTLTVGFLGSLETMLITAFLFP